MKWLWSACGHLCIVCGVIGIFLPLWPTTPFLLLAFFCYSKGSETFEHWLLEHPRLGPPVRDWLEKGAIKISVKRGAVLSCCLSALLIWWLDIIFFAQCCASIVLLCVSVFIISRPSTP